MAPFDDVSVTQMKPASKYYFAGSQRVAVRTGGVLNFLLSDQLGSTNVTLDVNGVNVGELRYSAFGETRKTFGSTPTDYRYTGQREEAGIGLYYYNARWYDSQLGRFVQADSIVPPGVQGLDRYVYGLNNPSRYKDPDGHRPCDEEKGCEEGRQYTKRTLTLSNSAIHQKNKDSCEGLGCTFNSKHQSDNNAGLPTNNEENPWEVRGFVVLIVIVEVAIILPAEITLIGLTSEATVACGAGVALSCLADIPLAVADIALADFGISLAKQAANSIREGHKAKFEWAFP